MANPTSSTKPENRFANQAKDVASQAIDKGKDMASQAMEKGKEIAHNVGDMASHAASTVGKQADHLASSAGSGMKSLADTIQAHTPREGMLGSASQAVAGTIREGGKYLEEEGLSGIAEDLTSLVRRNPVPAILIGIGLGFLIGRTLRS